MGTLFFPGDSVMRQYGFFNLFCISVVALCCFSCAQPQPKEISLTEQVTKEVALGAEMSRSIEDKIQLKTEKEVSIYLRKIAEKLLQETPKLKGTPVGVLLIGSVQGKWKSFGLPGGRVYLSIDALKMADFENEVAAMIALELAFLENREVLKRLQESQQKMEALVESFGKTAFFGPLGILTLNDEAAVRGAEEAVGILYRAGYDSRGLPSLLNKFGEHSATSPFESGTIERMVVAARRAISRTAPLRNPVVKSEEFSVIQKRIKKL